MNSFFHRHLPDSPRIYFLLLLAMAVSLPLSKALMSIVPGFLMLNWLIEGQFSVKFSRLKEQKSILLFIAIFFVYLTGLLWTTSMEWGIHDVKIQLPLLILPLVIGTSGSLNYIQVKKIVYTFSAAVAVASLCSIWVLLGFSSKTIQDPREMSLFISHIRFALLINISIFSLAWYFRNCEKKNITERVSLGLAIAWLTAFLFILKSVTGWVVFGLVLSVIVFGYIIRMKQLVPRIILLSLLFSIFLVPTGYIYHLFQQFHPVETLPANISTELTRNGNRYSFDPDNKQLENGHYIFWYINEDELREAWNKRSTVNYDSSTASGYNQFVLIRYLTSKGLRKDAEGMQMLTDSDIRNIENGMTNYRFSDSGFFFKRIYEIIWEFDVYRKGGNPSGHSVTQRIEYYKMAMQIIGERFWFGHGTGGYFPAYQEKYDQNKFFKDQQYRQRSHNMFLSYWIDFGLIGLIFICICLSAPAFMEKKTKSFLLMVFLFIILISFLNEDTLNNHDAISFFAFLYPLYLYSHHENPKLEL